MDALGVNIKIIRHSRNEYYNDLSDLKEHQHLNMGIINVRVMVAANIRVNVCSI